MVAVEAPVRPVRQVRGSRRDRQGRARAGVALGRLDTLWFNTGTLCNLDLRQLLYRIEPDQRPLVYHLCRRGCGLSRRDRGADRLGTARDRLHRRRALHEPALIGMVEDALDRGFQVLVLTNAMKPMMKCAERCSMSGGASAPVWSCAFRSTITAGAARVGARPALLGPDRATVSPGSGTTASASRSPAAPCGARRRRSCAPATRACSPSSACRWMPMIRAESVLFPEMDATARRARDHRGVLGHPRRRADLGHVRQLAHGGEAQGCGAGQPSSPAPCCPTTRSSSSAQRSPRPAAR